MKITPTANWSDNKIRLFVLEPTQVTETYVGWLNDPTINCFLESRFNQATLASTRSFVEAALAHSAVLFLGIHSMELGRHVGNIKLGPIDHHHLLADIGIMIGDRNAWNKSIATSAIKLITKIARDELKLRKLTAGCYGSNVGSVSAFRKAEFAVEGRRPAHFLLDGRPEDMILMGYLL